jgi:hypothetical protein
MRITGEKGMADRKLDSLAEFESRKPCAKQASLKPAGGWYKAELAAFCKKHNVKGCSVDATKPQLCSAIARYFDGVGESLETIQSKFESKDCGAVGPKGWRVADLREMIHTLGLKAPPRATKKGLCLQLSSFFRGVVSAHAEDIFDDMTTEQLKQECLNRGLKGCRQTKIRETFLRKLRTHQRENPQPFGISDDERDAAKPAKPAPKRGRQVPVISVSDSDSGSGSEEVIVSLGEKEEFNGELHKDVNDMMSSLAAMLYLLKMHTKTVCLPVRLETVNHRKFLKEYCDFELCWFAKTTQGAVSKTKLTWTFGNREDHFWEDVINGCKTRFAVMPLHMTGAIENAAGEVRKHAHHNYIVIDRELRTFERFEPNGTVTRQITFATLMQEEALDEVLAQSARAHRFKYISPLDFCPLKGPQRVEVDQKAVPRKGDLTKGFCTYWSIWYADRRLRHPDIPPKKLLAILMDEFNRSDIKLTTFIRNYAEFFEKERRAMIDEVIAHKPGAKDWNPDMIVRHAVRIKLAEYQSF